MQLREWQKKVHKTIREKGSAEGLFEEGGHIHVYQTGLWPRVYDIFQRDFVLLRRLVGASAFERLTRDFLTSDRGYQIEITGLLPVFVRYLEKRGERATVLRAAKLDLLASDSHDSPEPSGKGPCFGLHPSARLLAQDGRHYVIWREEGVVRRERIRKIDHSLLECFVESAGLAEITHRLEGRVLRPAFVQNSVALWTNLGLIVSYPVS